MKAIERHIEEMNRYKQAIDNTKSICLKNDYYKKLNKMFKELKLYCIYREYDFNTIRKKYKL